MAVGRPAAAGRTRLGRNGRRRQPRGQLPASTGGRKLSAGSPAGHPSAASSAPRGSVLRDPASLNKLETLPWDRWGLILPDDGSLSPDDLAPVDRAAKPTLAGDAALAEVRAASEGGARLRVPDLAVLAAGRPLA